MAKNPTSFEYYKEIIRFVWLDVAKQLGVDDAIHVRISYFLHASGRKKILVLLCAGGVGSDAMDVIRTTQIALRARTLSYYPNFDFSRVVLAWEF